MLFAGQRHHSLQLPAKDKDGQPANVAFLIDHLCQNVMQDTRQELFILDHHLYVHLHFGFTMADAPFASRRPASITCHVFPPPLDGLYMRQRISRTSCMIQSTTPYSGGFYMNSDQTGFLQLVFSVDTPPEHSLTNLLDATVDQAS